MNGRMVVGIDPSAPGRAALSWSLSRAIETGQELELLHAVEIPADHEREHDALDTGRAVLAEALAYARSRYPRVSTRLARADPFKALVEASRTADMLVIGTHKTGFIQGRSLGARFLALASVALCPVAVIPAVPLTSRRGVVVAVDDSATGRVAVERATQEALCRHEELTFLYADPRAGATSTTRQVNDALVIRSRTSGRGLARELIDASLVSSLVVVPHPQARRAIGTAAGALIHDVLLNLGGPALVVPRSDG